MLEAVGASPKARWAAQGKPIGMFRATKLEKATRAMTKTLEAISEAIRDPKHPFRKADNQPRKQLKHRYERRKIREFLHLGDWKTEEAT
jgi:hypothetical protein